MFQAIVRGENCSIFSKMAVSLANFNGFRPFRCQKVGDIPGYVAVHKRKEFEKISPFFGFQE